MRGRRAAGDADDRAARIHVPVRRAEPRERGHDVHAVARWHAGGERLALGRGLDDAEAVAQPLHRRAGDEDAAFDGEALLAGDARGDRRQQPMLGEHRPRARVLQNEAAGAVRVLDRAGIEAALAEERGLLVARDAGDRDRASEDRRVRLGDGAAAVDDARQHRAGDVQLGQHTLVPVAVAQVVEHRARRVRGVDDVGAAAREFPDQPRIDGAERQLARLGARLRVRAAVIEQPAHFRAGEVGVDQQARPLAHLRFEAAGAQIFADGGGAAALPDDGVVDGSAGLAVPDERRLALVRDADRGDVFGCGLRFGEQALRRFELRRPDRLRIVRDPAGLREDLRKLERRLRDGRAIVVEEDGAAARRALVEREDVLRHAVIVSSGGFSPQRGP